MSPEEEDSILSQIGSMGLSGVQYIGETLDKALGGRAIRGGLNMLAGGDTPWSELLSILPGSDFTGITNAKNAASGRDVLDNAGILNPNVEGFHPIDNPTDALGDVLGFGAEILLDPSTYIGGPVKFLAGGIGAAAKGGKLATQAGMKGLLKEAAIKAGTGTGMRRRALEGTGGKLADYVAGMADDATKARYVDNLQAARGAHPELADAMLERIDPANFAPANPFSDLPLGQSNIPAPPAPVLNEPLFGAMSYGIPFVGEGVGSHVVGAGADLSGAFGKYIVDPLDKVNEFLRYGNIPGTEISPGRMVAKLFDNTSAEGLSKPWQSQYGPQVVDYNNQRATEGIGGAQGLNATLNQGLDQIPSPQWPNREELQAIAEMAGRGGNPFFPVQQADELDALFKTQAQHQADYQAALAKAEADKAAAQAMPPTEQMVQEILRPPVQNTLQSAVPPPPRDPALAAKIQQRIAENAKLKQKGTSIPPPMTDVPMQAVPPQTAAVPPPTAAATEPLKLQVLRAIDRHNPGLDPNKFMMVEDLRKELDQLAGGNRRAVDEAIRELSEEGMLAMHRHGHAQTLTPEARDVFVQQANDEASLKATWNPDAYFNGLTVRPEAQQKVLQQLQSVPAPKAVEPPLAPGKRGPYKKSADQAKKELDKQAAAEAVNPDPKDLTKLDSLLQKIDATEQAGGNADKLIQQYEALLKKTYKIKRTATSVDAQANLASIEKSEADRSARAAAKDVMASQDDLLDETLKRQAIEEFKAKAAREAAAKQQAIDEVMRGKQQARGGALVDKLGAVRSKKAMPPVEPPRVETPPPQAVPPTPPPDAPKLKELTPEQQARLAELKTAKQDADKRIEPLLPFVKQLHAQSDFAAQRARKAGVDLNVLNEQEVDHVFRRLLGKRYNTFHKRTDNLKNIRYGTLTLGRILQDEQLAKLLDQPAGPAREAAFPQAIEHVAKTYGDLLVNAEKLTDPAERAALIQQKSETLVNLRHSLTPEQIKAGGFGGDITENHLSGIHRINQRESLARVIGNIFHDLGKTNAQAAQGWQGDSLGDIASEFGLDPKAFKESLLSKKNAPSSAAALKALDEVRIPREVADDLRRFKQAVFEPESETGPLKLWDTLTNYFKGFSLAPPKRTVRDTFSSLFMAGITGNGSLRGIKDAVQFAFSNKVPDHWKTLPAVKQWLQANNLPATPQNVRAAITRTINQQGAVGPHQTPNVANMTGIGDLGGERSILEDVQALEPMDWKSPLKTLTGKHGGNWKPWDIRGTIDPKTGDLRSTTNFRPVKASEELSAQWEFVNRLVPFIHNLEKNSSFQHAADVAKALNVDYSSRNFTRTEKQSVMRLLPFYKYSRKIIPTIVDEIMQKPGGGLANTFRAYKNSQSGEFTPEHLQGNLAIPVGSNNDGTQRYLTQIGLPIETLNTFHFGQGGLKKTGLDLLGMTNPLVKAPLEQATGRQFFSDRDLRDLDPRTGRILKSLGVVNDEKSIPQVLDQLLMNSPASSTLSMLGQLTDSRKGPLAKAVNLSTGFRLSDIDLAKQKEIETRKLVDELLRGKPGVHSYSDLYVEKGAADKLDKETQALLKVRRSISARASSKRAKPKRAKAIKVPKVKKTRKRRRRKAGTTSR